MPYTILQILHLSFLCIGANSLSTQLFLSLSDAWQTDRSVYSLPLKTSLRVPELRQQIPLVVLSIVLQLG